MNLNILKNELRLNFKKYLWWNIVWILLFILLFSFFDSLKESGADITSLVDSLGEFGEAFYPDLEAFTTIRGYFNGEAFIFYLLVSAIFMGFTGVGLVGGEINNKQITFLLSRQVSRFTILTSKLFTQILLLIGTALVQATAALIIVESITTGDDHSFMFFLISFVGAIFIQLFFLMLGILIGLYSQTGGLIAAGFGFVFWIIDLFSSFGDFSQNLKYFTPFYYFDVKYVIQETSLDVRQLAPLIAVIIILYVTSIWKFYNTDARG